MKGKKRKSTDLGLKNQMATSHERQSFSKFFFETREEEAWENLHVESALGNSRNAWRSSSCRCLINARWGISKELHKFRCFLSNTRIFESCKRSHIWDCDSSWVFLDGLMTFLQIRSKVEGTIIFGNNLKPHEPIPLLWIHSQSMQHILPTPKTLGANFTPYCVKKL